MAAWYDEDFSKYLADKYGLRIEDERLIRHLRTVRNGFESTSELLENKPSSSQISSALERLGKSARKLLTQLEELHPEALHRLERTKVIAEHETGIHQIKQGIEQLETLAMESLPMKGKAGRSPNRPIRWAVKFLESVYEEAGGSNSKLDFIYETTEKLGVFKGLDKETAQKRIQNSLQD